MCRGPMQLEPETVDHAGGLCNKCSAYGLFFLLPWMESSHNTENGYALTPADPAYRIVTRHLDVDIRRPKSKEAREPPLHRSLVDLQFRPFSDNSDVGRNDPQSANPSISHDTSQKHGAIDSHILFV